MHPEQVLVRISRVRSDEEKDAGKSAAELTMDALQADVLLECEKMSGAAAPRPPVRAGEGEMHVVPLPLRLVKQLSSFRVSVPRDLRSTEALASMHTAVRAPSLPTPHSPRPCMQPSSPGAPPLDTLDPCSAPDGMFPPHAPLQVKELRRRYPEGLPLIDPIEDLGITDPAFQEMLKELDALEKQLAAHPVYQMEQGAGAQGEAGAAQLEALRRKAELLAAARSLKLRMKKSHLSIFDEELKNRQVGVQ